MVSPLILTTNSKMLADFAARLAELNQIPCETSRAIGKGLKLAFNFAETELVKCMAFQHAIDHKARDRQASLQDPRAQKPLNPWMQYQFSNESPALA